MHDGGAAGNRKKERGESEEEKHSIRATLVRSECPGRKEAGRKKRNLWRVLGESLGSTVSLPAGKRQGGRKYLQEKGGEKKIGAL